MLLEHSPVAETYEDTKNLLYMICHRFQKKFGGEFDELLSEAHVAFMSAYQTFNQELGYQFNTLVGTCVKNRLLDLVGKERRKHNCTIDEGMRIGKDSKSGGQVIWSKTGFEDVEDTHREFNFDDFTDSISPDGSYIVKLTLQPTEEILKTAEDRGGQFRNFRSAIRDHLLEIGWSYTRVTDAFNEIKEVLRG